MLSIIRRTLPLLGAAWVALTSIHVLLEATSGRGVLSNASLSPWARISLLCAEASVQALILPLVAAPLWLLTAATNRIPPKWQPVLRGSRILFVALGLGLLAAGWACFSVGGRFLDPEVARFAARNFGELCGYGMRNHSAVIFGSMILISVGAFLAAEGVPHGLGRLPSGAARLFERGCAAAVLGVLVVGAASPRPPASMESAGPLLHLAAWYSGKVSGAFFPDGRPGELVNLYRKHTGWRPWDFFIDVVDLEPPSDLPKLVRQPRISLDQYLSGVDLEQLRRWNVIVILIDSFRADQLQATGGAREVMPRLERLAQESRSYPDCYSQASHTNYAAPAAFSSHYPLRGRLVHLYPQNPTYPREKIYDILKRLGWRTALFSSQNEDWCQMSNYMVTGSLDRVFHPASPEFPKALLEFREPLTGSLDDSVTLSEAIRWTEESDAPFFLYLNLQNAHIPYAVPKNFPHRFGPATINFPIDDKNFPEEQTAVVKELYADSLAYVDVQMDRLFARLKERNQWDRTLVVVTGDHGEAFFEHGTATHANGVDEEVMRVPLVIRAPGLKPMKDTRPAQLIDIPPTIAALLGLPPHPGFQGEDLVGSTIRQNRTRYLLCQTPSKTYYGIVRAGFKMTRESRKGETALFDLGQDPGEKVDVSARHPEILGELKAWLSTWRWAQNEYYGNPQRHADEFPPIVEDP